jgi:hypothetical protein
MMNWRHWRVLSSSHCTAQPVSILEPHRMGNELAYSCYPHLSAISTPLAHVRLASSGEAFAVVQASHRTRPWTLC